MSSAMLGRYQLVFAVPGTRRLIAGSVVGRLPQGMVPLALLLLVSETSESFASAGIVVAVFAICTAAAGPVQGALVDRFGQSRLLIVGGGVYSSLLVGIVIAVEANAPIGVTATISGCAGAVRPPIAACARTLWQEISPSGEIREAAYAIDAVAQEIVFIGGPLIVAILTSAASPAVAILLAAAIAIIGTVFFATAPAVRAWRGRMQARPRGGALASGGLRAVLVTVGLTGCIWGTIQVGMAALADELGSASLAGVFLALLGIGSIMGGVWYGSKSWRSTVTRRYCVLLVLMAACTAPLVVVRQLPAVVFFSLVAGAAWAPAHSCQYVLVGRLAPAGAVTEAFTWTNSALIAGLAIGSAVAGTLVEVGGAAAPFAFAVAAAGAAGLGVALARRRLGESSPIAVPL